MNQTYTTIEQAKLLIKLGIDEDTSDMHYVRLARALDGREVNGRWTEIRCGGVKRSFYPIHIFSETELLPAWSFSALLELIPTATLDSSDNHHYRIGCRNKFTEWHETAVDAAVAMIKRLKELNEL